MQQYKQPKCPRGSEPGQAGEIVRYLWYDRTMKVAQERQFVAVFAPITGGGFDVSFPDFPGCVTFGTNFEDAQLMAREALELWIEELQAQGEQITLPVRRPVVTEISVHIPFKKDKPHAATYR